MRYTAEFLGKRILIWEGRLLMVEKGHALHLQFNDQWSDKPHKVSLFRELGSKLHSKYAHSSDLKSWNFPKSCVERGSRPVPFLRLFKRWLCVFLPALPLRLREILLISEFMAGPLSIVLLFLLIQSKNHLLNLNRHTWRPFLTKCISGDNVEILTLPAHILLYPSKCRHA